MESPPEAQAKGWGHRLDRLWHRLGRVCCRLGLFGRGGADLPRSSKPAQVTEERPAYAGIEQMRKGRRTGDVSAAIQNMSKAMVSKSPVNTRDTASGRSMHEGPQVPNIGMAGTGCSSAGDDHRP
jgi:hypothetical protein